MAEEREKYRLAAESFRQTGYCNATWSNDIKMIRFWSSANTSISSKNSSEELHAPLLTGRTSNSQRAKTL